MKSTNMIKRYKAFALCAALLAAPMSNAQSPNGGLVLPPVTAPQTPVAPPVLSPQANMASPQPGQYQGYTPQPVTPTATQSYPSLAASAPNTPPAALPPLPSDFELGAQANMPLTPEQIRDLRRMLDARQRAAADLPNPPKSVTATASVSLSPGATPPLVRPFYGVSTSIVILDSTGQPWPVENFGVGNKSQFTVERLDGPQGSTFIVSPLQMYGQSNLILKLAGSPTPVVISLVSGQKTYDARMELRIQGRGPNAQVTSTALTTAVDGRMLSVLDGVPPAGRTVQVRGDDQSQAWVMPNGRIWLRTRANVVSPAPLSFVSASDGTRVYELSPSGRILVQLAGQYLTLSIEGCLQECSTEF